MLLTFPEFYLFINLYNKYALDTYRVPGIMVLLQALASFVEFTLHCVYVFLYTGEEADDKT